MSYESKVLVINRSEIPNLCVSGQELARFDLACMGYDKFNGKEFPELFSTPIDFNLYVNHSDEVVDDSFYREDCYGKHCNFTRDIDEVIAWLEESQRHEPYRRAEMLLNFLKLFKYQVGQFDDICLVHYGY